MKFLYIISICSIIVLGALTSYSDIKFKKAYNKHLLVFLPIGVGIQITGVISSPDLLFWTVTNIIITAAISIVFYSQHIWAAGDAKLFSVMIMLIPYQFYSIASKTLFPAFYCLSFVFTIAIVYVLIESITLLFKDQKQTRLSLKNTKALLSLSSVKEWLLMWLTAFLVSDSFAQVILHLGNRIINDSSYLVIIVNVFVSIFTLSVVRKPIHKVIVCGVFLTVRIILACVTSVMINNLTLANVFIILVSIIIRNFANRYNYLTIATKDIKVGDILAQKSLVGMIPSTVKGLPKCSDESTRCRLNEVEVAAIKRWKTSKYGSSTIVIVRTLPFVPFIVIGILFYIVFTVYLGV